MRYSFFKSIRTQLLWLVLISLLPALGIIVYSGLEHQQHEVEGARDNAIGVVESLGNEHERAVENTRQFLMTIARLPEVQGQNASACNKLFAELHKENPLYSTIFAATAEGMVFANALPSPPFSIRERKYFSEVLRTKGFSVGEYMIGVASKIPVLPCAYPVLDHKDRIKGFVVVGFDLSRYGEIFSKAKLPKGTTLAITDHKGIFLYSSFDREKYIGQPDSPQQFAHMTGQRDEGIFDGTGINGQRRLYAFKRFSLPNQETPYLFMRIGITEEQAFFHARRFMLINVMFLGATLLIAVMSAWFVGNVILVRRLNTLAYVSRQLGHDDLTARTGLASKQDELGEVAEAFDEMAAKLEQKDSQRKLAEEALNQEKEALFAILESDPSGVTVAGRDGAYRYVNPEFTKITGYTLEDVRTGRDWFQRAYPDQEYRKTVVGAWKKNTEKEGKSVDVEFTITCKDGSRKDMEFRSTLLKDFSITVMNDITDRKQAQTLLKESEERYRILTEESIVGVYILQDNLFRFANDAFARIHGYTPDEIVDKLGPKDLVVPEDLPVIAENITKRLSGEANTVHYEFRIRRKDGAIRYVEVFGALSMYNGAPASLGTSLDITERKEMEEKLHTLSIVDELTGLYNRRGFFTLAQQQFKLSERDLRGMILFFADTDRMKWINDTLGHQEGDKALVEVSTALRQAFRESDIIGRIGGDEFAILAIDAADDTREALIRRLQNILDNYNKLEARKYMLSLSIGTTLFDPENPATLDELIARADAAMYEDKKNKQH